MKVGIIGGTGGMGKGFAVRWCKDHNVLIGSRDAERANASAQEYLELVKESFGSINRSSEIGFTLQCFPTISAVCIALSIGLE